MSDDAIESQNIAESAELHVQRPIDAIRQILAIRGLPMAAGFDTPVVGTAVMEDRQMEILDTKQDNVPSEIVGADKTVKYPDFQELLRNLPANPAVYETRYLLDTVFRYDNVFIPAAATQTIVIPTPIPNGKYAFLDEIHIAQLSGAGSSPNGFLTDQGVSQLYAIITPDGSTFGASYKSGRNIIPGGTMVSLQMNALLAGAQYLVSIQYAIKTKIELPELDLSQVFGGPGKGSVIYDEGSESGDVNVTHREWPDGPNDFAGYSGDV
jgi:hypothetical protein